MAHRGAGALPPRLSCGLAENPAPPCFLSRDDLVLGLPPPHLQTGAQELRRPGGAEGVFLGAPGSFFPIFLMPAVASML